MITTLLAIQRPENVVVYLLIIVSMAPAKIKLWDIHGLERLC